MRRLLKSLRNSTEGFAAFEFIIIVPAFVAAVLMVFSAFDMYRIESRDAKASVAIADAMSRETGNITESMMETFYSLQGEMVRRGSSVRAIRATVVRKGRGSVPQIRWSSVTREPGMSIPELTEDDLRTRIPTLARGEIVVLVETFLDYQPASTIGFKSHQFRHFTVTRPRNAPQLCWSNVSRTSRRRRC